MLIQEYWAKLVVSGLAPECDNIFAVWESIETFGGSFDKCWLLRQTNYETDYYFDFIPSLNIDKPVDNKFTIQLRKDGIDLYKLEWQKPTEVDIGKMCWFYNRNAISLSDLDKYKFDLINNNCQFFCVLTTNGRLCPTVEDFEEAYK
jgi:hypothetical protein